MNGSVLSTEIVYFNQKNIISQFTIGKKISERIRSGNISSGENKIPTENDCNLILFLLTSFELIRKAVYNVLSGSTFHLFPLINHFNLFRQNVHSVKYRYT